MLKGKSSKDTPVRDVMSSKVFFVSPEDNVESCMALMTEKRLRHLPVMEQGKLVGLVSIGDVVKAIITDQQRRIQQLEAYLSDTYPA